MPSPVKQMYLGTILRLNVKDRLHCKSDSAFKGSHTRAGSKRCRLFGYQWHRLSFKTVT